MSKHMRGPWGASYADHLERRVYSGVTDRRVSAWKPCADMGATLSRFCLVLIPLLLLTPVFSPAHPGGPLTLDDAVRLAREHSPRLRAARMDAVANQVSVDREKPVARPTLTARATGTEQGPRVTFPRGSESATVLPEQFGRVELTLEQLLYRPGMAAARVRYIAQSRANQLGVAQAENDLVYDVRKACLECLTARAMLDVARQGLDVAKAHRQLVADMLVTGMSAERDLRAAEADEAEAQQGVTRADNGAALAASNVNRLLGRAANEPLDLAVPTLLPAIPESSAAGETRAAERRPEVQLLSENLRAAQAGVSLARTEGMPSVSARATVARQTGSAFVDPNYYGASLELTWNLLDGGKTRSDVREAQARVAQLEALTTEAMLGLRLEVEKAWRDMRDARARLEAAEKQSVAAKAALDVSELRYKARQATQVEVSAAILGLTRARANQAQALYDLHIAAADYVRATAADLPTLTKSAALQSDPQRSR